MNSEQLQLLLTEYQRKKIIFNVYDEDERLKLADLRSKITKLQSELMN